MRREGGEKVEARTDMEGEEKKDGGKGRRSA